MKYFAPVSSISAVLTILCTAETQAPYKSQLQEYAQKRHKDLPSYDTIRSGPPHPQLFKSTVTIDGRRFYSPRDYGTKKEAEFAAAAAALMALNQEENPSEQMLLVGSIFFSFCGIALIGTASPIHQH